MLGLSLAWMVFCLVQVYRLMRGWSFGFSFQFRRRGVDHDYVWPAKSTETLNREVGGQHADNSD